MTLSYILETDDSRREPPEGPINLLITGAAGHIGSTFARHAHSKYNLRLVVHPNDSVENINRVKDLGQVVTADITDLSRMKEITRDIHTVLHLAANANASQTWDSALPTNIVGTYNTFAAAKANNVRKIVFASSIHAVSGYPLSHQVRPEDPINPGDLYGVSKCFGEALVRYMAEQENIPAIALRIGGWFPPEWVNNHESIARHHDVFISARDLNQLIEKCIDDRTLRFAIFNAISDNTTKRLDIQSARDLVGYEPQDDFVRLVEGIDPAHLAQRLTHSMHDSRQQSGLRNDLAVSAETAPPNRSAGKPGGVVAG